MNPYEWVCFELRVAPAQADACVELFWELGTIGLEETRDDAGQVVMKAFFPGTSDEHRLRKDFLSAARRHSPDRIPLVYRCVSDPDDWVENYKKNFHAFAVGTTFYIHPTWEAGSSDYPVNLVIDPGHAFGTGTHESTQLCLLALEDMAARAASLVDIGTGSGILAMAARKLNPALQVVALDVDIQAIEMASENIERNRCSEIDLLAGPPAVLRKCFDLVVANLALGIFQQAAPDIVRVAGKNMILSGFTVDQEALVVDLFRSLTPCNVTGRWEAGGWVCLRLTRQSQKLSTNFTNFTKC